MPERHLGLCMPEVEARQSGNANPHLAALKLCPVPELGGIREIDLSRGIEAVSSCLVPGPGSE